MYKKNLKHIGYYIINVCVTCIAMREISVRGRESRPRCVSLT